MANDKKDSAAGEGTGAVDDGQDAATIDATGKTDDAAGGEGEPAANGDGGDANQSGDKKTGKKEEKTFTESEYQKRLAKDKAKWEKEKDLPEIEKLKTANQELAAKVKEREISDSFSDFAAKEKAKNVSRLLKIYREDLEIADDGSISNLKDIFESAKTDFPEFFAPVDKGSADAGEGKSQTQLTLDQRVDAEFSKTGRTHAFKL